MKVQTNYCNLPKLQSKNVDSAPSFKAFAYTPRAYKEGRDAVQAIFKNSKGWQSTLLKLYQARGEHLNNLITAFGTACVAPFFIRYNPVSREDKDSKAYSAWRQPISAVITLAGQLTVINAYNKMLNRHAATAGVVDIDLSAKPPESVLKKQAKLDYKKYCIDCLEKGVEHKPRKEWISNRIIELQDEAFYAKLREMRSNPNIEVSYEKIIRPKELSKEKDKILKTVLIDNGINQQDAESFKDYADFVKRGKNLCKTKNLNFDIICDSVSFKAHDNVIQRIIDSVESETKVKHAVSEVHSEMLKQLAESKVKIMKNVTTQNLSSEPILTEINRQIEEASKSIFDETLKRLKNEIDIIAEKADSAKTEAELIKEHVYQKLLKQGSICNVKNHGVTYDEVKRSVMLKKMLSTHINFAEVNLKNFKDKSGMLVALAVLPITCTILNWAYPKIMKKCFPRLSGIKEAKKAELREARAAELAKLSSASKEVK